MQERKPVIITCDAGGTMTDLFLVDAEGGFSVGKASTTPANESMGFWESLEDAFQYWGIDLSKQGREVIPAAEVAVYTGTTMVNTLLQRRGAKVGCLVTKGFEDSFTLERGYQKIAGYSYADRLHSVTRMQNEPLVPKRNMKGVTERIDVLGNEVIPLYENDVRQAVEEFIKDGIEAIVVTFIYSYINPSHEQEAARLAHEVMVKFGREVPVFLSSEICPIVRELPRLNSTVLHAYTAELVRKQLFQIEAKLKENDFRPSLQTFLSYGGLADIRYPRLYESMISGPAGGLVGAGFVGGLLGESNIITADLGGTSFDVGVISAGVMPIKRESEFARFILNLPMVVVDSVGAGVGTYIRIDPVTNRMLLGPESAGADPGPVAYDMGNETPTIADCDLIVGILNPDYYLGGTLKLNREKALRIFKAKIADSLGMDVYEAAESIIKLNDYVMSEHLRSALLSRGHSGSDYVLAVFGGAGPMHMASFGFPTGMSFKGVVTFPFAAAFSAFGCATVDFIHRYHKSTTIVVPPGGGEDVKAACASELSKAWEELEKEALLAMVKEGFKEENVTFEQMAFIKYGGQIDDLEVRSPAPRLRTAQDFDALIARFEDLYSKVYTLGARFPAGGFQILEVAITASVSKVKPKIEVRTKESKVPEPGAFKETRRVYHNRKWREARVYEMGRLRSGNEIEGPAIVEAPNTTLFIPEERKITVDEREFIWME